MKTLVCSLVWTFSSFATGAAETPLTVPEEADTTEVLIDDIRFEAEDFQIDPKTKRATVKLTLTSLKENPRELKINVYGTQLVDDQRNAYYFSTIELGRVTMQFADKQNYLHYLLQPNTPVPLTITADGIGPEVTSIQVIKVVFEDGAEPGRFLDVYLTN